MKDNEQLIDADYIRHIVGVMKERFGEDAIVLFHVADNYECFLEDSTLVSKALELPQGFTSKKMGQPFMLPASPPVNWRTTVKY